ncbi:MAG TPA: SDR family oxidoreductase [Firmicutes bacterium]|nr:SDR family oxidoreductase [Bacillota bacterium]
MLLEGKIALVTGAGGGGPGGMGKGIALCLAREGADIAVNDIDAELAEATAGEIRAMGRRAIALPYDVTKDTEVDRMVAQVVAAWGGIDILVNSVGLGIPVLVEDMTTEEWRTVLARNLDAPFYCSRAVIPVMKQRGGGKIITIGSMAGKTITNITGASYTAAKAGVLGFTRQLANEVGPYNINVNVVCPAGVVSDFKPAPPAEELEKMENSIPVRKATYSEDIGNAVVFLASAWAGTITGTSIDVDGGVSISIGDWDSYVKRRKDWVAANRKEKNPLIIKKG